MFDPILGPIVISALIAGIATVSAARIQKGRIGKTKDEKAFSAYERLIKLSSEENDGLREENVRLREVASEREEIIVKLREQIEKMQVAMDEKNALVEALHIRNEQLRNERKETETKITEI